ncbi:MAG: HAD hydrolase-like protein [Propionibacteriaceae bacterium]|nr:HAD hydrolase-like protein [Propionibacteriaceae bacterium]
MGQIRHIIWDWNGTLLDDTALTVRAAMAGLAAIGHPREISLEQWRQVATRPLLNTYKALMTAPLLPQHWKTIEDVWHEVYRTNFTDVQLNETTLASLDEAQSRGMTQSIVSLHRETILQEDVASFGITDRFTHITGTTQGFSEKYVSKADEVRTQLADLNLDPSQVVMIGDMIDDAAEGVAAGVEVILVPVGDTSASRLTASGYPTAESLMDAVRSLT